MLRDFPLLFDVRDVELTSLNMYLKDLFTGYRGAKERSAQKTASKLEKKGWTASEEKHPVTKRARGVLRCGGAFTLLLGLVSHTRCRGWFIF